MIAGKLDAILPLMLKDYQRFRVLDYSIKRFFECLNILWIVTRKDEYKEIASKITDDHYRVLPEDEFVPELRFYRPVMKPIVSIKFRRNANLGWYVQQLIKMAIAPVVETDFYLTLDADVLCLRTVRYSDLVRDGRAVTNTTDQDWHADWYRWAERVLNLPRSGLTHGVTPAILSKKAMIKLHNYLAARSSLFFKALGRFAIDQSPAEDICRGWRAYLLRNIPWTEYALYYTYLEATKSFDEFHVSGGPDAVCDNYSSVWYREDVCEWDPARLSPNSFFMVVQSYAGLTPDYLMKRIRSL